MLRDLHAVGVPVFALTNWSDELFPQALERFDFLGLFDDIVVSGAEGLAKPDPADLRRGSGSRIGRPLRAASSSTTRPPTSPRPQRPGWTRSGSPTRAAAPQLRTRGLPV